MRKKYRIMYIDVLLRWKSKYVNSCKINDKFPYLDMSCDDQFKRNCPEKHTLLVVAVTVLLLCIIFLLWFSNKKMIWINKYICKLKWSGDLGQKCTKNYAGFFFCLSSGRGNSAFETATAIYDKTNFVHMVGRHRLRFAWETHYVGDLRYEWYTYNVEKKITKQLIENQRYKTSLFLKRFWIVRILRN